MKEKMSQAFKQTPQRFVCSIEDAVKQATCCDKNKAHKSMVFRCVVIAIVLLVMIPVTVFGAVKLFSVEPKKVSNFGISFSVTPNPQAPKYIKMVVDLPDGFEEMKNTGRAKYHRTGTDEHAFSILPMHITKKTDLKEVETDVEGLKQITLSDHLAYEVIAVDGYRGLDRYYVWFENANVLMLIYRGDNVTFDELEEFVKGIKFVKGTESDHDSFYEPDEADHSIPKDDAPYDIKKTFVELDKDEIVTFFQINEETNDTDILIKSYIKDIQIKDDINGLNKDGINKFFDILQVADSDGVLLPETIEIWQNGDGVHTKTEFVKSEEKAQQLVLIDIEFENTSDKDVELYIPHRLETLKKTEKGEFELSTVIDKEKNITANPYCDTEIFYLSEHGDDEKSFYIPTIKAMETKTITVGFRCAKDQVDNAYVTLSGAFDGISSPNYTDYSDNLYTYYIFKVK